MKRKLIKVLACIMAVCLMAGTLAACGDDSGNDTPNNNNPGNTNQDTGNNNNNNDNANTPDEGDNQTPDDGGNAVVDDGTPFPAYDLGGVTITLLNHNDLGWANNPAGVADDDPEHDMKVADRQENIDRIESKYNVHLEFVDIPTEGWDDIAAGVVSEYVSGHPIADVMDAYFQFAGTYVANDILYDFTADLAKTDLFDKNSYFEWQSKVWGVSSGIGGEGLYYNKKWIEEMGMEYTPAEMFDMGKWSYDDFKQYLRDMKSKMAEDEYPLFLTAYYWILFASAANGEFILDPSGNLNYVTDPMLETLQVWQDLVAEGLISKGDPVYNDDGTLRGYEGWSYPGNTFGQGHTVAMAHRASWQADGEKANVELGFVPYPWGSNVSIGHTGNSGDYLTLGDNYKATYYDGQLICMTKGIEAKGDPVQILTMVLDLMGWSSKMSSYVAPESSRKCGWLEDGLDKELYFFSSSRERLEPYNSLDLPLEMSSNLGRFMRDGESIRSNMISYYNTDMQIMIDYGFSTADVFENYEE